MGVRITPTDRMAVRNSSQFYLQATGAGTNVLNVASSLGRKCLALMKFVEGGLNRFPAVAAGKNFP